MTRPALAGVFALSATAGALVAWFLRNPVIADSSSLQNQVIASIGIGAVFGIVVAAAAWRGIVTALLSGAVGVMLFLLFVWFYVVMGLPDGQSTLIQELGGVLAVLVFFGGVLALQLRNGTRWWSVLASVPAAFLLVIFFVVVFLYGLRLQTT